MSDSEGAIKEISRLTEQGLTPREIDGLNYLPSGLSLVKEPTASPLNVSTLQAIVHYIDKKVDNADAEKMVVHVSSHGTVDLCGHLTASTRLRETLLMSSTSYKGFPFGDWLGQEQFVIALHSMFVQTAEIKELLTFASNVTDQAVKISDDDGVTQRVTAKAGIQQLENVAVKGRYTLQPHRTFLEVEQPESEFIFRIKSGAAEVSPRFGLFEADSGEWKLQAIKNVADWLKAELESAVTIMA